MKDELGEALAAHRLDRFPDTVGGGTEFGLVDAVMIGADIYGWALSTHSDAAMSQRDVFNFRRAADELSASLLTIPQDSKLYFVRILLLAELALARLPQEV